MTTLKQAWARLVAVFRKRSLDEEFDEELRAHIHLATEDYLRRGMPLEEARRMARMKFGAAESSRDAHRDSRGLPWLDGILHDLRFAVRGLRRDRAFTLAAVAMLALAIGLNVTTFAVMNTMLFRGFPMVKQNNRIVYIQEHDPLHSCCMAWADFEDYRKQAKSFERMAFVGGLSITFSESGIGRGIKTWACEVSANAFSLPGVQPMLGRDFTAADEVPGAARVAILDYSFWDLRLGKRADIVGRTVRINNAPVVVIGVMPEGFTFPEQENLWIPVVHTPALEERAPSGFIAFGRLANGATVDGARAEVETIGRRLAAAYPASNRGRVPTLENYSHFFIGPDAPLIYGSLWAGSWLVLLIACANLANLALARAIGRSREFSTRIALGAGQWRMTRQILIESLMLGGAGGVLGWWIAGFGVRTYAAETASVHQILDYRLDGGTLAWLCAVSVIAAVLFSIVPVGRVLQLDVNHTLKGDGRGVTQGAHARSIAAALVAGQMALAVVLLSGAGILVRSFLRVVNADVGVTAPDRVLTGHLVAPPDKYASPDARVTLFDRLKEKLETIPGVEAETVASDKPLDWISGRQFELDTKPVVGNGTAGFETVLTVMAGPDYVRTIGAAILAGREFQEADRPNTDPVAMVNKRFADEAWPGKDAVGKRLRLFEGNRPGEWRTVVGVVSNVLQRDPTRQQFLPVVYVPFRQKPDAEAWFFVRTRVPVDGVAAAVRAEVQRLDPDIDIPWFSTLKTSFAFQGDRMDVAHQDMGKNAVLSPIFAVIALLLAVVGLYAVIARSVSQRTKEIGIRMAVGAQGSDIRGLIFREGMLPVAFGLILGLAASLGVNRILQSQLVGVSPYDPVTLTVVPVVLILVAWLGCQIPARRAINVDPAVALRQD